MLAIVAASSPSASIEPRLGPFEPARRRPVGDERRRARRSTRRREARGLRFALVAFLGVLVARAAAHAPAGAPLRDPVTGDIIGTTPFMDSLLFIITLIFLVAASATAGAGTFTSSNDVIAAVTKTFAGLAGLVFMLLMISQFIAYFNYSQPAERARGRARGVARDGRASGPCRC